MEAQHLNGRKAAGHWPDIARQWERVGSPLRPVAQDLGFFRNAIERWRRDAGRAPRALILGVTPELNRLPWPDGTNLLAADHTQAMIDAVWPGPRSAAVCAEWTQLPFDTASRDIVLCDGGVHLLAWPHEHIEWVRGLLRVIAPGGCCALRLFVPPERRESPAVVLQELLAGRVPNLNILKLRLGMALQESREQGVQLARVWNAIHDVAPDSARLAEQLGWSLDHLLAINTYRDCLKHYHFLSTAEVCELFCGNRDGFRVETIDVPTYELGERCPTVVFRRGQF